MVVLSVCSYSCIGFKQELKVSEISYHLCSVYRCVVVTDG